MRLSTIISGGGHKHAAALLSYASLVAVSCCAHIGRMRRLVSQAMCTTKEKSCHVLFTPSSSSSILLLKASVEDEHHRDDGAYGGSGRRKSR